MELRQLAYFVAVAEEANFTKAATKVRVAQPAVSAQVRQLEEELGQQLFDRSGRKVRLTKVGLAVLPYARAALDAITGARLVVNGLVGLTVGRIAVGMVTSCASLDLVTLLADFHRAYPAVEIALLEDNSAVGEVCDFVRRSPARCRRDRALQPAPDRAIGTRDLAE
jgi:DNA-binding transcriptional LysR family regulator